MPTGRKTPTQTETQTCLFITVRSPVISLSLFALLSIPLFSFWVSLSLLLLALLYSPLSLFYPFLSPSLLFSSCSLPIISSVVSFFSLLLYFLPFLSYLFSLSSLSSKYICYAPSVDMTLRPMGDPSVDARRARLVAHRLMGLTHR